MVEAGGVGTLSLLQTRKLFISRTSRIATIARIASARYTAGTWRRADDWLTGMEGLGRPYSNRRHPVAGKQPKVEPAVDFSSLIKNSGAHPFLLPVRLEQAERFRHAGALRRLGLRNSFAWDPGWHLEMERYMSADC